MNVRIHKIPQLRINWTKRKNRKSAGPVFCVVGLLLVMLCTAAARPRTAESPGLGKVMKLMAAEQLSDRLLEQFVPLFSFAERVNSNSMEWFTGEQMHRIMPLYAYGAQELEEAARTQNRITIEMILQAEGEEGTIPVSWEGIGGAPGESLTEAARQEKLYGTEAPGAGGAETMEELTALMEAENQTADGAAGAGQNQTAGGWTAAGQNQTAGGWTAAGQNQTADGGAAGDFIPHTKQNQLDMAALADYETLVKTCYTISDNTMIGSDQLNVEELNGRDMSISKEAPGPQILIYHTHSQEGFADSVPGDASTSIVGVGQRLTDILTEQYGYQVLHHTGQYDVESRDDAYSKSLPAIQQILEENPAIQVVIDLHRDGVAEGTHLVTNLDGRPTAQFMFFNGLSRTRKTGNISYLYNENLDGNLAFSFQMQKTAMEYYPGLTRKIFLKGYRYNMHLREKTLLIELGAQTNTVEEAMNACDPLAHMLDIVLSGAD